MSSIKKHKKITVICIAILLIVAIVTAAIVCLTKSGQGKNEIMSEKAKSRQSTILLAKQDLVTSISATGTIEAAKSKSVTASVNGAEVQKVYVAVGDTVKKGAKLLTFDTETLSENLADAKENLSDVTEEADESITQANTKLRTTKSAYQKAKAKTPQNEQEISQAKEAYTEAKTQLQTAKKNKTKAVKEATKKVEEAEEALKQCTVTAPIAGMITSLSVEAGDTYAGGSLLQIDDTSSYIITTTVDEYDISSVKVGQKVVALTETTGDDELEGTILFVSPTKGDGNMNGMNSGSDGYEVKISLNSDDDRLRLDLTAKLSIVIEEAEDVFAVPYDAVHETEDGKKVIYVANDMQMSDTQESEKDATYTEIEVTVGMETDYYVEISGADLSEGMRVIMEVEEADETDDTQEDEFALPGMQGGDRDGMPGGGMQGGDMPSGGAGAQQGGGPGNGGGAPSMPGQ